MTLLKISKEITNISMFQRYCPLCGNSTIFKEMTNDMEKRQNAMCPICGSLERHRFLYYIYKFYFLNTTRKVKILHIAPEEQLYKIISANKNIEYVTMDINPSNYSFAKNIIEGNITKMPFKNNQFDFILHNQVLEHINNEEACLDECIRVLKSNGKCIINIPYTKNNLKNFEDNNIKTTEERIKYYYQSDHVRLYGQELLAKYEQKYNLYKIDEDCFPDFVEKKLQIKRDSKFLQDAYYILNKS